MKGEYIYANGLNISQSRKLFKFYFGDFFLKAEKNESKLRFDVYIKKRIKDGDNILLLEDFVDLDYFTDYWNESKSNPKFNILVLDIN
jgi:hypothetical protein